MSVLCVIAHPDDIELMAGGTLAAWIKEGHQVHVLTFTDGVWTSPDGVLMRDTKEALLEEKTAADFLGYKIENLGYSAMDLEYKDKHVCEVLQRIDNYEIDTVICPFDRDLANDHEVVARISIAASKRVKRVLMGQINYYLRKAFSPNFFVDISNTWTEKIDALQCFRSQWQRAGEDWYEFADYTTRYYGKMCGVERAEGFVTSKFLY